MFESLTQLADQEDSIVYRAFDFISKRPGSILYFLYILGVIALANNNFIEGLYDTNTIFVHFLIFGLVVVLEHRWVTNLNNPNVSHHYLLIKQYWQFFFFGGIMAGSLNVMLAAFFNFLPFNFSLFGRFIFYPILSIAIVLTIFLSVPSFYKILNEDPKTFEIKRLVSSPSQLTSFSVYFLAGMSIPVLLFQELLRFSILARLFPAYYDLYSSLDPSQFNTLEVWKGEILFLYLIPLGIYFGGEGSKYIIKDGRIFFPDSDVLFRGGRIFGIYLLIVFISIILIDLHLHPLILHFVFLLGFVVATIQMKIDLEVCDKCNFIKFPISDQSPEFCYNCDYQRELTIPIKLPTLRQAVMPQCPSCGKNWDEPTRQCSNCKYTLILACPHCGNTLNPLWQTCVHCKNKVVPIPQLALSTKGYAGFQKSVMDFLLGGMLLLLSTVFFGSTEFTLIDMLLNSERFTGTAESFLGQSILGGYTLIITLFGLVSAIILFTTGSDENKFPMLLISSRLISSVTIVLIFFFLMGNIIFLGSSFLLILGTIASLVTFIGYLFLKWKSLWDFTPQVSIDWEVNL
ncbi:MAG: zinc ribbon domain-containing protein [Methanobacteriota archaeon]|nr:MAG: zinc ribbon domain-containing protein [Euryarchaeota archaeon]